MLINKNKVYVNNNKKVLHKVGKKWVTVSTLLLALLGGTAVASKVSAHADNTQQSVQHSVQPTSAQKKPVQPSQSTVTSPKNNMKIIGQQANQMHTHLLSQQIGETPNYSTNNIPKRGLGQSAPTMSSKHNIGQQQNSNQKKLINPRPRNYEESMQKYHRTINIHGHKMTGNFTPSSMHDIHRHVGGNPNNFHQDGTYRNLNYSVNNNRVDFTGGYLNGSDGVNFIKNAPSYIQQASDIVFDQGKGINTSGLSDMTQMFESDYSLRTLDLSGMDTSNVKNMKSAFANDFGLQYLNLGNNFSTQRAVNTTSDNTNGTVRMFQSDSSLNHIYTGQPIDFGPTSINSYWYQTGQNWKSDNSLSNPEVNLNDGTTHQGWLDWFGDLNGTWGTSNYNIDPNDWTMTISNGIPNGPISILNNRTDLNAVNKIVFNNVTLPSDASSLFAGMESLKDIDLRGLKQSKVTNLNNTFASLPSLEQISDLSNLNTSDVHDMTRTFASDPNLTVLSSNPLPVMNGNTIPWNTSNVDYMTGMFQSDKALNNLNLSSFDTSKVQSTADMFESDPNLADLQFVLNGQVNENLEYMFTGDNKLNQLSFDNVHAIYHTPSENNKGSDSIDWDMLVNTGMSAPGAKLILNNSSLTDGSGVVMTTGWQKDGSDSLVGLTAPSTGTYINKNAGSKLPINEYDWGTAPIQYSDGTGTLTVVGPGTLDDLSEDGNVMGVTNGQPIKHIVFKSGISGILAPSDSSDLLADEPQLSDIENISDVDTTGVTSAKRMFASDDKLTNIDLSKWNMPKVNDMSYMFGSDTGANQITLPQMDNQFGNSAAYMNNMFANDGNLRHLDLRSLNTSNATDLDAMFLGDNNLITLLLGPNTQISHTNGKNGMTIDNMFLDTPNLALINIGNNNTSFNASSQLGSDWYLANSDVNGNINTANSNKVFGGDYTPSDGKVVAVNHPTNLMSGQPYSHTYVRGVAMKSPDIVKDTIIYKVSGVPSDYQGPRQFSDNNDFSGENGQSFDLGNNTYGLPSDYSVINSSDTRSIQYDGGTHTIAVKPDNKSFTINWVTSDGTSRGTTTYSGMYDTPYTITASDTNIPSGFQLENKQPQTFTFDGNSHNITVIPNNGTSTIIFMANGQSVGKPFQLEGPHGETYTIQPSDSHIPQGYTLSSPQQIQYGQGPYYITLNPASDTTTVDFIYNGQSLGSQTFSGSPSGSFTITSDDKDVLPTNYTVTSPVTLQYKNPINPVQVAPRQGTDNVTFMYNGQIVGSKSLTGPDTGSYNIMPGDNQVAPAGYTVQSETSVPYNRTSDTVQVVPSQSMDTISFMYNGQLVGTKSLQGTNSESYLITPSDNAVLPQGYTIKSDVSIPYGQSTSTVNVYPETASDVVTFYLTGTNQELGTHTFRGRPGGYFDLTPADSSSVLPSGYQLLPNVTDEQIEYNTSSQRINLRPIKPNQNTVILKFVNQHGQQIGAPVQKQGNSASDTGVGDTAYVVQPNDALIPLGYELPNNKSQSAAYDGKVHVINIIGKLHAPTSNTGVQPDKIMFDNPKDQNNRDNTVAVTYHLVTPGVSDSTHTAYINVSGRTGDTTSLSPQLYSPNGYKVTPSDTNANILFTPTGITPNNVTWTFEGKAKKLPQPKPKSHKQKPVPKPTPIPKPIPKKHTVKPRVVVHPHKVVIPQHQQVMPPKPKQIHVYPRTIKHELPQTGEVHHTNALLDASLMLLASISLAGADMLRRRKDI